MAPRPAQRLHYGWGYPCSSGNSNCDGYNKCHSWTPSSLINNDHKTGYAVNISEMKMIVQTFWLLQKQHIKGNTVRLKLNLLKKYRKK